VDVSIAIFLIRVFRELLFDTVATRGLSVIGGSRRIGDGVSHIILFGFV